jgi:hypothetical protein
MVGKLESKLNKVLCFQDTQKKLLYRQYVKEKEARAHQIAMMRHLGMTGVKSGSEKDINPEDKLEEKTFQWTDRSQFVSIDDLDTSTSRAMESPPGACSTLRKSPSGDSVSPGR